MSNLWKPRKEKPEENYVELTMFNCIYLCNEYISKQVKPIRRFNTKGEEKYRKYLIADVKRNLKKVELDIKEGNKEVCVIKKVVGKMKYEKDTNDKIAEMISGLMERKKELALVL